MLSGVIAWVVKDLLLMQEEEYFGVLKLLIWLKGAMGISKTCYGMLYLGWLDCIWFPSIVAHIVLWLGFVTNKTHKFWLLLSIALKAFRFSLLFVHQQPSLLSSQRNWIKFLLLKFMSAVPGVMGAVQGTVFSLCWSVWRAVWAVWEC